jgi:hypothetical protein
MNEATSGANLTARDPAYRFAHAGYGCSMGVRGESDMGRL